MDILRRRPVAATPRTDARSRRRTTMRPAQSSQSKKMIPMKPLASSRSDDLGSTSSDDTDASNIVRNASATHERMMRERMRIRENLARTRVSRFARAPGGGLLDRVTGLQMRESESEAKRMESFAARQIDQERASKVRAAEARAGALRDSLRRAEAELAELRRATANGDVVRRPAMQASDPQAVREAGAKRVGTASLGKAARKLARSRSLSKKKSIDVSMRDEKDKTRRAPARDVVSKYQRDTTPQAVSVREEVCLLPKPIFVVSDSTGATAAKAVQAALGQFEQCMHMPYPTNLEMFRFINDKSELAAIVQQAKEDDALIVYTLAEVDMSLAMASLAGDAGVRFVNVWENLLKQMEEHMEIPLMNLPMIKRPSGEAETRQSAEALLSSDYYRMIEAVEYTRQCDDGASSHRWREADILILGISRTGKTPLSIFLGQRGYKVANYPLVPIDGKLVLPPHIADVDPRRVFCLMISADVLHSIRAHRLQTMGVADAEREFRNSRHAARRSVYSDLGVVRRELELARALYASNDAYKILDVTHKGVEETAARIMAVMSDRFGRDHRRADAE